MPCVSFAAVWLYYKCLIRKGSWKPHTQLDPVVGLTRPNP